MNTGQVIVKGPMTKEEKVVWDRPRAGLDECDREIEELTAMLKVQRERAEEVLFDFDGEALPAISVMTP